MKKIKAFSLTEAMIIIVILAIAVAATTPIISRKIVNITEAGSTIGGGAHGRYEIFSKEYITFGGDTKNTYEKTTDPSAGGGSSVIVFRRLDDPEYTTIKGENPKLSSDGVKKATLYEQITPDEVYRDSNGAINYVEFKDPNDGIVKKFPVGGRILIESSDVKYIKGCLENTDPKEFNQSGTLACAGAKVTLPNDKNRIIEGNLVEKFNKKHPVSNNILWHLDVANSSNYDGVISVVPWERLVSGENPIIDRPLPKDPSGNYVGTFTPADDIQNITLHGVGGGGAGGAVGDSELGKAVSPKTGTSDDLKVMKNELAKRFNEVTGANIPADTLVKVVQDSRYKELYKKKYTDIPEFKNNDKTYILLNKYDGTITVKVDVRKGKYQVFPHQLLDYTKVLGTQTQDSIVYDMPVWGSFSDIYNRGFYAGIVGQGCAGGAGSTYTVDSSEYDTPCRRTKYCPSSAVSRSCLDNKYCKSCIDKCAGLPADTCTNDCSRWYSCVSMECTYRCDGTHYSRSFKTKTTSGHCFSAASCPSERGNFNKATCITTFPGGAGGAAPAAAVACDKVKEPITLTRFCFGPCNGISGKSASCNLGGSVTLQTGTPGRTCAMTAGNAHAVSRGGGGGQPVGQPNMRDGIYIGDTATQVRDSFENMGESYIHYYENVYAYPGYIQETIDSYVIKTTEHTATANWVCEGGGICGTSKTGKNGAAGSANSSCKNLLGIDTSTEGEYNHIYTWTTPYSMNRLAYGEAGSAGEYKTTNISKLNKGDSFKITLGTGGVNVNATKSDPNVNNANGPDGTDTVVTIASSSKEVLRAKGGKGGQHSKLTNRYDLCYAQKGTCAKRDSKGDIMKDSKGNEVAVSCCDNEYGSRSTVDINATIGKASLFENIKALVGKSQIVGIGLGRGGEGVGSRAGSETVGGQRSFINASAHGIDYNNDATSTKNPSIFLQGNKGKKADVFNATNTDYKNKKAIPSALNFKGGDGAVIIVW